MGGVRARDLWTDRQSKTGKAHTFKDDGSEVTLYVLLTDQQKPSLIRLCTGTPLSGHRRAAGHFRGQAAGA